jgi:hypothetical protein
MVTENKMLRRIFGPKRDEVMGGRRKQHNEELRDLYSSPSRIRIIKSRRVWWVWYVARMGKGEQRIGFGRKARRKESTRKTKT